MDRFLVDTDWLESHLADPELRIFDCTVVLVPDPKTVYRVESGRAEYDAGHIRGAGFIDLQEELSDPESELRFTMPSAERFASGMSRHGVGPGTRVVLYSAGASMWATRIWWMLRVFGFDDAVVLDGGWEKWRDEGRPVSTDPCKYPRARFEPRHRPGLIASREDVQRAVRNGGSSIINALSPRQHTGESEVHYGRRGRIAGSVNVPAARLVDAETRAYLPTERLRALFEECGASADRPVITYCGGGIAASSDAFVLAMLGYPDVALYDGSLSDWVRDPSLPMETG